MAYEINEAKALVVEAGKKLVNSGLIARTWGNVSARISDTQFVITPSGRAYETLTPDEIVVVNIADCKYDGDIKPSSEKGVHADAYRLRPDVNFVIHTHQVNASVVSAVGIPILGVPCADYGMPSTGTLREGVAKAIEENPDSKEIIMQHHGALCMGADYEEAFKIAGELEKTCGKEIKRLVEFTCGDADSLAEGFAKIYKGNTEDIDLGTSKLVSKDSFLLTMADGSTYHCSMLGLDFLGIAPRVALLHAAIYNNTDAQFIGNATTDDIKALSLAVDKLHPYLDDFAQIAGQTVEVCNWNKTSYRTDHTAVGVAAKGRSAVILKGIGALCYGSSLYDIEAVKLVLEKECKTEMYSILRSNVSPLSPLDCFIMRTIYVLKYSKQANK